MLKCWGQLFNKNIHVKGIYVYKDTPNPNQYGGETINKIASHVLVSLLFRPDSNRFELCLNQKKIIWPNTRSTHSLTHSSVRRMLLKTPDLQQVTWPTLLGGIDLDHVFRQKVNWSQEPSTFLLVQWSLCGPGENLLLHTIREDKFRGGYRISARGGGQDF